MTLGKSERFGTTKSLGRSASAEWRGVQGRDLKLKREVAFKVVPETLSRDPERVERMRREAEVLHP
jgi:hypothetical protein